MLRLPTAAAALRSTSRDERRSDIGCAAPKRKGNVCAQCGLTPSEAPFCTVTGFAHKGCAACGLDVATSPFCAATGEPHTRDDTFKPLRPPMKTTVPGEVVPLNTSAEVLVACGNVQLLKALQAAFAVQVCGVVEAAARKVEVRVPVEPLDHWAGAERPVRLARHRVGDIIILPPDQGDAPIL